MTAPKKYLFSASLFEQILHIANDFPKELPSVDNSIDVIVQAIEIPRFQKSKIEKMKKMLEKGDSISNVLASHKFHFPCNEQFLEKLNSANVKTIEALDLISLFSMLSTISWYHCYDHSFDIDLISPIINVLSKGFDSNYSKQCIECVETILFVYSYGESVEEIATLSSFVVSFIATYKRTALALSILSLLCKYAQGNKMVLLDSFIESLTFVYLKDSSFFPVTTHQEIISMFNAHSFESSCNSCFRFLSNLLDPCDDSILLELTELIGNNLFQESLKKNIIISYEKSEMLHHPFVRVMDSIYAFNESSFIDGYDDGLSPILPDCIDLQNIIGEDLSQLVLYISKIVRNNMKSFDAFVEYFINEISLLNNMSRSVFISCVFVYFLSQFDDINPSQSLLNFLFSGFVFSRDYSILNSSSFCKEIESMRRKAIEILLSDTKGIIMSIFVDFSSYPLLFGELVLRLSIYRNQLSSIFEKNPKLIPMISSISLFYQRLNYDKNNNIKSIELSRRALFIFFQFILADFQISKLFFIEPLFINTFVSFLFEVPLQQYVISVVKQFLSFQSFEGISQLSKTITNLFLLIKNELPSNNHFILFKKMCLMLTDSFLFNRNYISEFAGISEDIIDSLITIYPEMLKTEVIEQSINLLVYISSFISFKQKKVMLLSKKFETLASDGMYVGIYPKLVQLMAGEHLSTFRPSFLVRHSSIVFLLFAIAQAREKKIEVIRFVFQLCKYSKINTNLFSSIGLEELLLKILDWGKNFNGDSLVPDLLNLFSIIIPKCSSPSVVMRYLSLMSPINDNQVSWIHPICFETLNQIVASSLIEPKSFMPLDGRQLMFPLTKLSRIEEGFSFLFWIYIEPNIPDYRPTIFSMSFMGDVTIKVFISGQSLFFHQNDGTFETIGKIIDEISLNEWHFVGVTYSRKPNKTMIYFSTDSDDSSQISVSSISFSMGFDGVKLSIGGDCAFNVIIPSRICNCGLYPPLFSHEQMRVFEMRFNSNPDLPFTPHKFIDHFDGDDCSRKNGFVDVLIKHCGVSVLLPLFSMNDLRFPDNSPYHLQFDSALILLTNVLLYNHNAQQSFFHSRGFMILSYLLVKKWIQQFSLKSYQNLCSLFHSLTFHMLQQQLFEFILVNISFISLLPPLIHLRIFKQWASSLFPIYLNISRHFCSFEDILFMLRKYFWYQKVDEFAVESQITKESKYHIKKCREYLFQILYLYADQGLSNHQVTYMISCIKDCLDLQQVIELLMFLNKLVFEMPLKIMFRFEDDKFLQTIYYLIFIQNTEIVFLGLLLLAQLFRSELLSISVFISILWSVFSIFPKHNITLELLEKLLIVIEDQPFLVPIICFISSSLENESYKYVILKLIPNSEYLRIPFWAVYPLLLFEGCSIEEKAVLCSFIILSSPGKLLEVLSQVEIVFQKFPKTIYTITQSILDTYIDLYKQNEIESSNKSQFFEALARFVFFYKKVSCSFFSINNCPFNRTEPHESNVLYSQNDFFKSFLDSNNQSPILYNFGIRFDGNGNWIDIDLVSKSLSIVDKVILENFGTLIVLSCSYLIRSKREHFPDIIHEFLSSMEPNCLLFDVFEYHVDPEFIKKTNYGSIITLNGKLNIIVESMFPQSYYDLCCSALSNFFTYSMEASDFRLLHSNPSNSFVNVRSSQTFEMNLSHLVELCEKSWEKLWYDLTIDLAPWHSAKTQIIYPNEKDYTLCFSFVPAKFTYIMGYSDIDENFFNRNTENLKIMTDCTFYHKSQSIRATVEFYMNMLFIMDGSSYLASIYLDKIECFVSSRVASGSSRCCLYTIYGECYCIELHGIGANYLNEMFNSTCMPLLKLKFSLGISVFSALPYTKMWVQYSLSTFEYLMMLNICHGKCFHDKDQYPFFPYVLDRYDSDKLHDDDIRLFRNSTKVINQTKSDFYPEFLLAMMDNRVQNSLLSMEDVMEFAKKNNLELTPEFYYMPELFENHPFVLPKWSESSIDFVYNHRKVLESDLISSQLHIWITTQWGIPHAPRSISKSKDCLDSLIQYQGISCSFFGVSVYSSTKSSFKLAYLLQDSVVVYEHDIIDGISCGNSKIMGQSKIIQTFSALNTTKDIIVSNCDDGFIVFNPNTYSLNYIIINQAKVSMIETNETEITQVVSCNEWMAISSKSSTIETFLCYTHNNTIKLYQESSIDIAISKEFKSLVCILNEEKMAIFSLVNGCLSGIIHLDGLQPMNVLITPSWGFIVSYCVKTISTTTHHYLCIHTINGKHIRTTEIPNSIHKWCSWSSKDGFDFLAFSNNHGKIYITEAYYLSPDKPSLYIPSGIHYIQPITAYGALCIVSSNSDVYLLPYN